jgi:hypothetical protein
VSDQPQPVTEPETPPELVYPEMLAKIHHAAFAEHAQEYGQTVPQGPWETLDPNYRALCVRAMMVIAAR